MKKTLLTISTLVVLQGCGGGGGDSGATTAPPVEPIDTSTPVSTEVNTADIQVSANFDFRTDRDVQLSVGNQVPGQGKVNVYYDSAYHDTQTDTYYPDYSTRVISFDPNATDSITIQVNRNWSALYVEFVPTYSGGMEQYHRLDLQQVESAAIIFD